MSHDDAFLQAIIANPDDDAPRLLYADWLEERGDPRGEFIRVQCALARMDEYDPRRWDLECRAWTLEKAHVAIWLGAVREKLSNWEFRRGFMDWVELGSRAFMAYSADLFRHGPLRTASIFPEPAVLPALLADPYLQRLQELQFVSQEGAASWRLRAGDVERIAALPARGSLTRA